MASNSRKESRSRPPGQEDELGTAVNAGGGEGKAAQPDVQSIGSRHGGLHDGPDSLVKKDGRKAGEKSYKDKGRQDGGHRPVVPPKLPPALTEERVCNILNERLDAKFAASFDDFSSKILRIIAQNEATQGPNSVNMGQRPQECFTDPPIPVTAGSYNKPNKPAALGAPPAVETFSGDTVQLDSRSDMGSLAGSPSRSWRTERAFSRETPPQLGLADENNNFSPLSREPTTNQGCALPRGSRLLTPSSTSFSSTPGRVSVDDSFVGDAESLIESAIADSETAPPSWPELIQTVQEVLHISPPEDPIEDTRASVLSSSFKGIIPEKRQGGPMLPADGCITSVWQSLVDDGVGRKSISFPPFKRRHRDQYRWPAKDFTDFGKVPEVDGPVSTYIASGSRHSGPFAPRHLYPEEVCAEQSLREVDNSLRASHRVVSHSSYILSALSEALKPESSVSEDRILLLLGGLASAISDLGDLTVRASARCLKARREIYLKAMNLPDKRAKADLMKVNPVGSQLFGGQVEKITHESSTMIRDVRETAKNYNPPQPTVKPQKKRPSETHHQEAPPQKLRRFTPKTPRQDSSNFEYKSPLSKLNRQGKEGGSFRSQRDFPKKYQFSNNKSRFRKY